MARIGIFDSGVGGLSVFKEIKKVLPLSSYIYFGDNANCPYGIKGPNFILHRSVQIAEFLISKKVDIIVIACNTATSYAVDYLNDAYNVPFVGTVPGVKPAAKETSTGIIGVLATFGTLNAPLYNSIKETWGSNVTVLEHIGDGFVELVENLEFTGNNAEDIIKKSVKPLVSKGADCLVLGCTHYPFLKETIAKVANEIKPESTPYVDVYDSAPAIARNVYNILSANKIPLTEESPTVELYSSGEKTCLEKLYEECL